MCTEFCVCPGSVTDTHYIEYSKVPADQYKKFERSFNVPLSTDQKQLIWNYMPTSTAF